ncbi:MAG: epoxide hydrolase N-terminal domain-containing protein [Acidimicrobiales bacterium]
MTTNDATINPFTIAVPDEVLTDLQARLRMTRWPDAEVVDDWSQGTPLSYIKEVCTYWAEEYDWRAREAALNRFAQFTTVIDDIEVHFIHVRSPHEGATPLLLTHGWPGSVVEFHKVIEPLVDPVTNGGNPTDAFQWWFRRCLASRPRASRRPPGAGSRQWPTWNAHEGRLGYDSTSPKVATGGRRLLRPLVVKTPTTASPSI